MDAGEKCDSLSLYTFLETSSAASAGMRTWQAEARTTAQRLFSSIMGDLARFDSRERRSCSAKRQGETCPSGTVAAESLSFNKLSTWRRGRALIAMQVPEDRPGRMHRSPLASKKAGWMKFRKFEGGSWNRDWEAWLLSESSTLTLKTLGLPV